MLKRKGFFSILVLLVVCLLIFFFLKNRTVQPKVAITAMNKEIPYVSGSEHLFEKYIADGLELYQISTGEEISITFSDNPPDTIEVLDYILNEDGTQKYSNKETCQQETIKAGNKYSFELVPNTLAFLSSDSADYKKYSVFRGILLKCAWDNTVHEYAFIIKSNAQDKINKYVYWWAIVQRDIFLQQPLQT